MADERPEITPEMMSWANRKATRYRLRYGDREGQFEGSVGLALERAVRTWRSGLAGFGSHCRRVVIQALNEVLRRSGPLGYRRDQAKPGNHLGAPKTSSIADEDVDLRWWAGPVGWEIDYEDYVVTLARRLPGVHGDVIRSMYLECAGATIGSTARAMGLSSSRVSEIHSAAIAKLRTRVEADL